MDSDKLASDDRLKEAIKHGTLGVGFIGLAETLTSLRGAIMHKVRKHKSLVKISLVICVKKWML